MSSNRPPVPGSELHGPPILTQGDVIRRRQAREKATRQREAPVVARRAWRDRDVARAAWLSGAGYSHAEVARMVNSTEERVGALLRKLGLRSRTSDGCRLLSAMVPLHVYAVIGSAARDAGLKPGAFAVGAAVAWALGDQPDTLQAVRHVAPDAEPPAVAVDPGPLIGDGTLPKDQADAIDASIRRLYSQPRPPAPPRRKPPRSK